MTGPGVHAESRPLPLALKHFAIAILLFSVIGVALAYYLHTRVLSPNEYHFADLYVFQPSFKLYGTPAFYNEVRGENTRWTYPDTMAPLYRAFYATRHPLAVYLAAVAIIVAVGLVTFVGQLRKRGISLRTAILFSTITVATSYPLWVMIDTSNLELFVVLVVGLGITAYLTGRFWWAGAFLGLAAALKLLPVIFLSLLFSRKHYRQLLFGLAVGSVYFIGSHWIVGPRLMEALRGTGGGLGNYTVHSGYGIRPRDIGFDHSLLTLVKQGYLILQTLGGPMAMKMPQVYRLYMITAALLGIILYFTRIRRLPPLNQALAITVLALLLPPVSYDYRLCLLYVPWAFLVLFILDGKREPTQTTTSLLFLFAILFTPQNYLYYWIGKYGVIFAVNYGAQVKVLLMLGVLYLVLRYPLVHPEQEVSQAPAIVIQEA